MLDSSVPAPSTPPAQGPAQDVLSNPAGAPQGGTSPKAARLVALDAWRGLTVLLMLLVNNAMMGSATPAQFRHAPWGGGVRLADLVFPWFLFCAGTAIPFSLAAASKAGLAGWNLTRKLLGRMVLLFLAGCFLNSVEQHALYLGFGVLQLIAVASLVGSLAGRWPVWTRLALALALLLGYDALIRFLPLPDGSVGIFEDNHNAIDYLNDVYLTPYGLRGLLSTIPTSALVLLGSVAGQLLYRPKEAGRAARNLAVMGALLTLLGWAWGGTLEFNKPFWTPSYITLSAGLGALGLLAFYALGDLGNRARLLAPLTWAGRNALFAYVGPILFKLWILQVWQVNWTGKAASLQDSLLALARGSLGHAPGGWAYTLLYIGATWLALWYLARRNLIWRL